MISSFVGKLNILLVQVLSIFFKKALAAIYPWGPVHLCSRPGSDSGVSEGLVSLSVLA